MDKQNRRSPFHFAHRLRGPSHIHPLARRSLPFAVAFLFVNVRSSASRPRSAYFESMQDPRFFSAAAVVDRKEEAKKEDQTENDRVDPQ